MARAQDFITEARVAAKALLDATNKLVDLQREYNALDYGTTLPDGTGNNAGITRAQVGAVVFDTANAVTGVFAQGHATNICKLL